MPILELFLQEKKNPRWISGEVALWLNPVFLAFSLQPPGVGLLHNVNVTLGGTTRAPWTGEPPRGRWNP
jgi:hypothetical protein